VCKGQAHSLLPGCRLRVVDGVRPRETSLGRELLRPRHRRAVGFDHGRASRRRRGRGRVPQPRDPRAAGAGRGRGAAMSFLRGLDPITFEILRNGFRALSAESSALVARVSYAPTITEGNDLSGALLSADAHLIAH